MFAQAVLLLNATESLVVAPAAAIYDLSLSLPTMMDTMPGPKLGDAFGNLLAAALDLNGEPGKVFEVIERDDGHVRVNDAARYPTASWGPLDDWIRFKSLTDS